MQGLLAGIEDDNERRAMMEDIAGKILLTCWQGISSEITQVLGEVINQYVNGEASKGAAEHVQQAQHISNIGRILQEVIEYIPGNGLDTLQRIMNDAADGISKYQLLLAKQAEGATWHSEGGGSRLKRKRNSPEPLDSARNIKLCMIDF